MLVNSQKFQYVACFTFFSLLLEVTRIDSYQPFLSLDWFSVFSNAIMLKATLAKVSVEQIMINSWWHYWYELVWIYCLSCLLQSSVVWFTPHFLNWYDKKSMIFNPLNWFLLCFQMNLFITFQGVPNNNKFQKLCLQKHQLCYLHNAC